MPRLTGIGPARRVGTAEPVHDLLHMLESQILGLDFNGNDHVVTFVMAVRGLDVTDHRFR